MKKVFEKEQFKERPSVLICGFGIVGRNIQSTFLWADLYDMDDSGVNFYVVNGERKSVSEHRKKYDFAFVCVPTPMKDGMGRCDISYVRDVLEKVDANIFVIKSTVPPKTTEYLREITGKRAIFSPEYQGNTQHANRSYNFVILGGEKSLTAKVAQLYQHACTGELRIYFTDSKTAELCKYMENCFLAAKVVFCNEFFRIARFIGINYEELRELFVADPRVNPSHTFVYEDYPYFDSKCFNKDLPALYAYMKEEGYEAEFIRMILDRNDFFRKNK